MPKTRAKASSAAKSRTTSKARSTGTRLKAATPASRRSSRPAPAASKSAPAPKVAKAPSNPVPDAAGRAADVGRGQLRERLAQLSIRTNKIAGLKRSLHKTFFDVGLILNEIRDAQLYEVKGYGSFEAFLEREVDINKVLCLRAARIAEVFNREAAIAAGLERAAAAVASLDGEPSGEQPLLRGTGTLGPVLPLHKQ